MISMVCTIQFSNRFGAWKPTCQLWMWYSFCFSIDPTLSQFLRYLYWFLVIIHTIDIEINLAPLFMISILYGILCGIFLLIIWFFFNILTGFQLDFSTLQDKHNIYTLSKNIKFICTSCEAGLKTSPKTCFSTF
jgi:hypothetical protein